MNGLLRLAPLLALALGAHIAGCLDVDDAVNRFCAGNRDACQDGDGGDEGPQDGGVAPRPDGGVDGGREPPSFQSVASMSIPRFSHTATRLESGEVLVVGGFDDWDRAVATAELYDPETGTWTEAGTLEEPRGEHTATLLADGRVLVAGGRNADVPLKSAELYDPASGTWARTGDMAGARASHAAVGLPSGEVLVVAGGDNPEEGLRTSELFDPSTGTWTDAGMLPTARNTPTATLMEGSVLAVGGFDFDGDERGADEYSLSLRRWIAAPGSMRFARFAHTATRLKSGQLLVVGAAGVDEAELYNPSTRGWASAGRMSSRRHSHTATRLLSDQVLITGGSSSTDASLGTADLYDPTGTGWTQTAAMTEARAYHTATLLLPQGTVLLTGGLGRQGPLRTAEKYIP
ncbi:Kelch repeat-containing protein [Myxococcus fulvus]|uniref:Kelch repeat-containing protein n=1 Tax=Myxococcus fulvus TaxID=33 RepID=UPI003B9CA3D5